MISNIESIGYSKRHPQSCYYFKMNALKFITTTSLFLCLLISNACSQEVHLSAAKKLVYLEIDSLNSKALLQLNINLASATGLADQAGAMARTHNYYHGLIESTCIRSMAMAKTNHCYKALLALNEAAAIADKTKDSIGMGRIFSVKGNCFYFLAAYDSAKIYHEKAIDLFSRLNASSLLATEYNHLAKVYHKSGETSHAGFYMEKAVTEDKKNPNADFKAWSLDITGEIYHAQRLFDKAIEFHTQSRSEFVRLNNKPGMASAALHAGNSFYMLIKDDSAKKYYNLALEIYKDYGDSNGIAICYSNLSRISLEGGNHKEALIFANKAIATIHGGDYKLIETATLQQLGDIYSDLEQFEKAIICINKALEIAKQINHKVTVMDCYKSLSEIYSAINNPLLSYTNLLNAYRLKDSIQPITFSRQLAIMQDQFETQEKENQIKLLEQNNRIKSFEISNQSTQINNRNIFLFFGTIIFILVVIAGYFAAQKKRLKNKLEQETAVKATEESERLRFARDVHDELGSGLSKINFLSELIIVGKSNEVVTKENASAISETAKVLIDNMRDLIWALNPENTTLGNLLARIREYASDYLEEYCSDVKMIFPDEVPDMEISKESHREIFMAIKECLNNVVKHSNAKTVECEVAISGGMLTLTIKDNGKGLPLYTGGTGNGLQNMRCRMEAIRGSFQLESVPGNGTLVTFKIELALLARLLPV